MQLFLMYVLMEVAIMVADQPNIGMEQSVWNLEIIKNTLHNALLIVRATFLLDILLRTFSGILEIVLVMTTIYQVILIWNEYMLTISVNHER